MIRALFIATVLFFGCKTDDNSNNQKQQKDPWQEEYIEFDYNISNVSQNEDFLPIYQAGIVENTQLKEASGLAPCTYRADWLYSHNDGGDFNRIFVMDTTGKNIRTITIPNSGNRDAEDIAVDPDIDGQAYIYWGDIGDNDGKYSDITVYRFPEEEYADTIGNVTSTSAEKITLTYPDGARDAETLLIDPWNHHMYLVSKRDVKGQIYRADYPFDTENTTELRKVAQLPFSGVVAGDISLDGHHIVLKTYVQAFYWYRQEGETLTTALSRQPTQIPYKFETQGESICWSKDANNYFTVSEGKNEPIYRGSRK